MMFKRDFSELGYFEKLFLVLFNKNDTFKNTIGNIYSNNKLFEYRKKKYPLIFFFYLYSSKMNYKLPKLPKLKKFFNFFKKSNYNYLTYGKIKYLFFRKLHLMYEHKNVIYDFQKTYKNKLIFLVIQKIFYKRYYNLCSSIYFKNYNENNLVKLNWLFYVFLKNSKGKKVIYDLSKYSDWYDFLFKKGKITKINKIKIKLEKNKRKLIENFRKNDMKYLTKMYKYYSTLYKSVDINYKHIFFSNFKNLKYNVSKFIFNKNWVSLLKKFYPIRFSESSVSKYIQLTNINTYLFLYIRKNRIFNKGRYSRNRQLYRTGVYWCLWLNIILVYGLYFLFYRFTFNFGYFWWGLLILFYSTIFSRSIKYNYFNIYKILEEFLNLSKWLGLITTSLIKDCFDFIYLNKNFLLKKGFYFNFVKLLHFIKKELTKNRLIYFWESMTYKDTSLFRYKSIIHWFTQLYKLLTY